MPLNPKLYINPKHRAIGYRLWDKGLGFEASRGEARVAGRAGFVGLL